MQHDAERDLVKVNYISGFADLAKFISSDADGDTAIFRRFETLAARNLLYLQSELAVLERIQDKYDREDEEDALNAGVDWSTLRSCGKDWESFQRVAQADSSCVGDRYKKRMDLVQQIRGKLKEYSMP